ncbi:MAG: DNA-directed RNA polymerase subunit alpha C-terminal domain-containing protein [Thermoguttaceae bacterium]
MATRISLGRAYTANKVLERKLQMSLSELGLSVRTTNCLEEQGLATIGDLLGCSREELLTFTNFGEKTLVDVYKALERLGFHRRGAACELQTVEATTA